jgi:eukaryotic-like serine/threonine-protein kinase
MRAARAADPDAAARFRAEARCVARLSHPGIAQVYDYWETAPPFLVMELVDGPSLALALAAGPLAPWRVLDIVAQVGRALHACHVAGVIHCDVKPANLVVAPGGGVKLTDFGIAHAVRSVSLTALGEVLGTPAYLAPERIAGRSASPASDVYSLGVVMYECLTGSRPFTGTMTEVALAHHSRPFPPLPLPVLPAIPALLADMTAKSPGARPASAAAVARRAAVLRSELLRRIAARPERALGHPVPATARRTAGSGATRKDISIRDLPAAS